MKTQTSKVMRSAVLCGLLVLLAWGVWQLLLESQTPVQVIEQKLPTAPDANESATKIRLVADESDQTNPDLEVIYSELEDIFLHSIGVNKELTNSRIQQLNAEINPALPQLLAELKSLPANEKLLKRRMALVDYFRYRMRWDSTVIPTLVAYIGEDIVASDAKVQAMVMADKAELLGGVAAVDPDLARDIASDISDPLMQDLAAYEVYFGLRRGGNKNDAQAMAYVHSFAPDFAL